MICVLEPEAGNFRSYFETELVSENIFPFKL